jgi:hypothetical protein
MVGDAHALLTQTGAAVRIEIELGLGTRVEFWMPIA